MTPDDINRRIAEACGWTDIKFSEESRFDPRSYEPAGYFGRSPSGSIDRIPDFYHDLNACHDMEKVLNDSQYHGFTIRLSQIGWQLNPGATPDKSDDAAYKQRLRIFCSATAPQRCEAFLRTIGQWEIKSGKP